MSLFHLLEKENQGHLVSPKEFVCLENIFPFKTEVDVDLECPIKHKIIGKNPCYTTNYV